MGMSILADHEISELQHKALAYDSFFISPFVPWQVKESETGEKLISYGLSSFGYDMRCSDEFKIFTNINSSIVDPKDFDPNTFVDFKGDVCIIPPNSFVLTSSVEYFKMPDDVIGVCLGKSTYARTGLIVNVTPIEPGWEGHITIEISNTTPLPARVYANEGIAQLLFYQGSRPNINYADRSGKYQGQVGVTLPRL